MQELARFTDPMGDAKAHAFVCTHAQEVGHFGRALKCALAHLDSKPGSVDMEHRRANYFSLQTYSVTVTLITVTSCLQLHFWSR